MGTADGMIAKARTLLGTGEQPPGSNHNLITVWYGFDGAWCDMSISYIAAHSDNLSAVMGKHAWTVEHAKAFKSAGRWHYGLGGIRAGDIVFYDWGGSGSIDKIDHVGLVEAVHSNGTITTLEGNTSDQFMRRVRKSCVVGYGRPAYGGGGSSLPGTDGMLRVGSKGNAVKTLQQNLNTVMKSGLTVDGVFGAQTETAVKAFQSKYKLAVDGVYGPNSAAMMKAALAGQSAPIPPKPKPPSGTLTVDGKFGPATCAALQRALNSHGASLSVDGSLGPLTRKALQKYLGVTQDGIVGPNTIKVLQKKVGATQDGIWGSDTTKRLQTKLNAGTF
jgi:peptidoglycan hydrolase-like protein with peptidoglycan-binding domain